MRTSSPVPPPSEEVVASRFSERISLAGRPDNAHLPLVPEGLCHALHLGARRTVCGLPSEELVVFPGLVFAVTTFLHRCADCLAAIGLSG